MVLLIGVVTVTWKLAKNSNETTSSEAPTTLAVTPSSSLTTTTSSTTSTTEPPTSEVPSTTTTALPTTTTTPVAATNLVDLPVVVNDCVYFERPDEFTYDSRNTYRVGGYPFKTAARFDDNTGCGTRLGGATWGLRKSYKSVKGWIGSLDTSYPNSSTAVAVTCDGRELETFPSISNGDRKPINWNVEGCDLLEVKLTRNHVGNWANIALADVTFQ